MEQGYRQLVNPKFVEKARLLEQLTPLRLGDRDADTAVVQLKVKEVTLRGLTAACPASAA